MVMAQSKIIENTNKYCFRSYGDPVIAYSLVAKILSREIFVTGKDVAAFEGSLQKIKKDHPNMAWDMVFKRMWNRYCSMATPLLFEVDKIPD